MENIYTISCHNGSSVSLEHNRRDRRITDKEPHIDPNGVHETWIDNTGLLDAYEEIFGEAVEEYNAGQKRKDRKTTTKEYLAKCTPKKKKVKEVDKNGKAKHDNSKKPCYEMIVGIYGKTPKLDENGNKILDANGDPVTEEMLDREIGKEILREFIRDWPKRNPNLKLIGVYYHGDEVGDPHIHVDYVPVARGYGWGMDVDELKALGVQYVSDTDFNAHGYKNGLPLQNSMDKALYEQGTYVDENHEVQHLFEGKGMKDTCQIQWQERERMYLDDLCAQRGIEVVHPRTGDSHLDTRTYQKVQDMIKEGRREAEKEKAVIISQAHDEAAKVRDEAEGLLHDARTVLEGAQTECERIVEDARDEARSVSDTIVSEARAEADEIKSKAADEAEQYKAERQGEALAMAADTVKAARAEAETIKADADEYREKTAEALRKREERLKDPEQEIERLARDKAEPMAEKMAEERLVTRVAKRLEELKQSLIEHAQQTPALQIYKIFKKFLRKQKSIYDQGHSMYDDFCYENPVAAVTYDKDGIGAEIKDPQDAMDFRRYVFETATEYMQHDIKEVTQRARDIHNRKYRDDFDDPNQEHELGGEYGSRWE